MMQVSPIVAQVAFPQGSTDGISIGASVAINGTCLTVTAIQLNKLTFDIIAETLRRTSLGLLAAGSEVNFERSARLGDEIGGHSVSGHIHTTATIVSIEEQGANVCLRLRLADASWSKYILQKGFIAVDGCSLTVGEV
jgi:riboflavin synthase